jgi:hypothetical protein
MSQPIPAPVLSSDGNEGRWHYLYRAAAIAALIGVALFLFQIVAFFVWPPPSTVAGHFALLQSRPLVGLVSLDFVIIVDEVLAIPLCLALYLSLRREASSVTHHPISRAASSGAPHLSCGSRASISCLSSGMRVRRSPRRTTIRGLNTWSRTRS